MNLDSRTFGKRGEAEAAGFLKDRGYRIIGQNVRLRRGEIDLVAYDGEVLVFVEVKARRGNRFGGSLWAVDERKQGRLSRLATEYVTRHRLADRPCRFDLVLIQGSGSEGRTIDLIQNAFDSPEEGARR